MSKYTNTLDRSAILETRMTIPPDLHWIPEGEFRGEIYHVSEDKYYSARAGKKYKIKGDHLDEGHFQGYRFAVQNYVPENGWVFDPTVGSGTAVVEAINNGRNGIGVELEWPQLALENVQRQEEWTQMGFILSGNAKDLLSLEIPPIAFDLIINGTPYPCKGRDKGLSSDAPMTRLAPRNYTAEGSFGLLGYPKGGYEKFIRRMYQNCAEFLREKGYLCLVIKDPMWDKKPFLLQKMLIDWIKEDTGLKDHSWFCHRHIPETLFMRTYPKRFGLPVPSYQIGVVLQA